MRPVVQTLILLSLTLSPMSYASETDQFLAWGADIKDAAATYDQLLADKLNYVIRKANKKKTKDIDKKCFAISLHFMDELEGSPGLSRAAKFEYQEKKANRNRYPVDIFPPASVGKKAYYLQSVHNKQKATKIKVLSRMVRIHGITLGVDKLSHMARVGYNYYDKYLKQRKAGVDRLRAMKYSMWRGVQKEATILGLKWGTFSLADLEANYQGMLMGINVCESENPHVKYIDGKWKVVRPITTREYVTPDFDESYNLNYYRTFKLKKVASIINEQNHCSTFNDPVVQENFERYRREYKPSFGQLYGEKLLGIHIAAESTFEKIYDENRFFPLTYESQTFERICSDQIGYDEKAKQVEDRGEGQLISACPTIQPGFSIRGRIINEKRRDINSTIANFIKYAESFCFEQGRDDFETISPYQWVDKKSVPASVPNSGHGKVKVCLQAKVVCK